MSGRGLRAAYWVWRSEPQVTRRAPVYPIGRLFLAGQGVAFGELVAIDTPDRLIAQTQTTEAKA